ncbi:MAG: 3-methyl-2-oxobutanoate hydroxymethyltransferase [Candidatus Aminicenantes bacterium]|nr:3-methyl-2-oxobutanoate hydroxymethyltransferase [Candidatus Aminicenantes bacterium]
MPEKKSQKITVPILLEKKRKRKRITALTAYDYPTAKIVDEAGIDVILVGDSLGMVVLGYENTIPVTMEEMIHHTKAVARGAGRALIVGDMPYFSYHVSVEEAVNNASRFLKEAGAHAVKIEGATQHRLRLIKTLVEAEIPVMGHVGLTPQSILHLGRFKVRGQDVAEAKRILREAQNLERAGVFSVILECVPMELARIITDKLHVPTIGIGAGPGCDGQILVFHDLVGYMDTYMPKFVKKYARLYELLLTAVRAYADDVNGGDFPDDNHSYHFKSDKSLEEAMGLKGRKE